MDARVTRVGAADEERGGEGARCQPKQPSAPQPRVQSTKISICLWSTRNPGNERPYARQNKHQLRTATPMRLQPGLKGRVSHFVDTGLRREGKPHACGSQRPGQGGGRPLLAACGFAVGDLLASTCHPAPAGEGCAWAPPGLGRHG